MQRIKWAESCGKNVKKRMHDQLTKTNNRTVLFHFHYLSFCEFKCRNILSFSAFDSFTHSHTYTPILTCLVISLVTCECVRTFMLCAVWCFTFSFSLLLSLSYIECRRCAQFNAAQLATLLHYDISMWKNGSRQAVCQIICCCWKYGEQFIFSHFCPQSK